MMLLFESGEIAFLKMLIEKINECLENTAQMRI